MKILLAKTAGFCMGVRRAVEMALDAPGKHQQPIYTFGPLIHNPQVLSLLEEKGITVLEHIPAKAQGTVLIRAHGVPPQIKADLVSTGLDVIDATCPRVIKVQTIIARYAMKGHAVIIVGDKDHPEVMGLLGYAEGGGHVVEDLPALNMLPAFEQAIVVAQTTQNTLFFEAVTKWVETRHPHYRIYNTICGSTEKRQSDVKQMAFSADAVVVVGGHSSGNTQRLVEIAGQTGKPAFHVENETELDLDLLASVNRVAITAGASTPNWVTARVYRTLESQSLKKARNWRGVLFELQRTLLLTSIYVAMGAGFLCYTCTHLQGHLRPWPHVLVAMLYVLSMHIFNNLTGIRADRYNDPGRAAFYLKHKIYLGLLAVGGGFTGLLVALMLGWLPFIVLLTMSILGLSYKLKLLPAFLSGGRYRRIRDIPGSKTVLIALAWGIVTVVLPALSRSDAIPVGIVVALVWAVGIVFVRSAFFDILDMQGDRIVGKGTIPILLGEHRTLAVLKAVIAAVNLMLLVAALAGAIPKLGILLAVSSVYVLLVIMAYDRRNMLPGIRLEFAMESYFVLVGMISLLWATYPVYF